MMTERYAEMFNGREYPFDPTEHESMQARKDGIVIIYGASDDLMEVRGAVDDEVGAYKGRTAYFTSKGLLKPHEECECNYCGYDQAKKSAKGVTANWSDGDYSWTYSTDIPHVTFEIMEDGEKYCLGIVFALKDVQ